MEEKEKIPFRECFTFYEDELKNIKNCAMLNFLNKEKFQNLCYTW